MAATNSIDNGLMVPQTGSERPPTDAPSDEAGAGTAATAVPAQQELVPVARSARPWGVLLVVVSLVATAALTASNLARRATRPSTSDAYIDGRVVRISPRVSGPVIVLNVDDNSLVRTGDVLLEIDPADYEAKADQARAAVAIAESAILQSDAAVIRAEAAVGEAAAALGSAQADSMRRASDYRRYAAMGTDGVSAQQLEAAKTAMDVGERQREVAEKKLAAANADLNVSKMSAASARSQLVAAQAQLRFAALQLEYTKVVAPESGAITKKNVEAGSFVSTAQPLMAIVPSDYWVVANFKEVQLERMRAGQSALIRVDAFPRLKLRGRVQSIQSGTGSRFQLLPPENATGNWVKVVQRVPVKILFDKEQPGIELLAPGMSVDVTVDTDDHRSGSGGALNASDSGGR
jgi:membrane fusion protein (multidrug efflux system)